MIALTDFSVESVQATAWIASDELVPSRVYRVLVKHDWHQVFDAEPQFLSADPAWPAELPSIILVNQDGSRRLEIARSRVNIFRQRSGSETIGVAEALDQLAPMLAETFQQERTAIGRLASVVVRIASAEEPARELARHYFQDRWLTAPLNRPQQLEIHAHKQFELGDNLVNSWMRVKTGFKRDQPDAPLVIVEQDINTLEEDRTSRAFTSQQVNSFFAAAAAEFDAILALYFPPPVSASHEG